MPELPEVETIRKGLEPLVGQRVAGLTQLHPGIVKLREFDAGEIIGKPVLGVYRRGKYLVLVFGECRYMVVHMGMSGRLYWSTPGSEPAKHTHFILKTEAGQQLRYEDPRRFGGIWFVRDTEKFFHLLGPEPLGPNFTLEEMYRGLEKRRAPVKSLLLDQSFVAGIGNIYADEILFAAQIHPARPAGSLLKKEVKRLFKAIREVLTRAIEHRGTTFRDYRDGDNHPGRFQDCLSVYSRDGKPCPRCGQLIKKIVVGGRGTHYCPGCQRL